MCYILSGVCFALHVSVCVSSHWYLGSWLLAIDRGSQHPATGWSAVRAAATNNPLYTEWALAELTSINTILWKFQQCPLCHRIASLRMGSTHHRSKQTILDTAIVFVEKCIKWPDAPYSLWSPVTPNIFLLYMTQEEKEEEEVEAENHYFLHKYIKCRECF